MQYIMNLWKVFRRQRHIRDGRNRFPIYVPVWAVPHQSPGIVEDPKHRYNFSA
jgi:hypothetical protein